MKRKISLMLAAAGMFAAAFQTWSFAAPKEMPSGRAENNVIVIDDAAAEKIKNSVEEDDDSALLYEETAAANFFDYGTNSRYAYQDMLKRDNAENKRKLYDTLYDLCVSFENNRKNISPVIIRVNGEPKTYYPIEICNLEYDISFSEVSEVYFPFMYDHPEFYWLDLSILTGGDVINNKAKQIYVCAGDDCASGAERNSYDTVFDTKLTEWLDDIRNRDFCCNYTIAEYLQNFICDKVKYGYDDDGVVLDTHYAHTIMGVLDDNPETDAVCEGYAKTFRLALNALGVENAYGVSKTHAWNYIMLDDKYYGVDVTWDDNDFDRHRYFAKGTKVFNKDEDHILLNSQSTGKYFLYDILELAEEDYIHVCSAGTTEPIEPTGTPEREDPADPTETLEPAETAEPTEIPEPYASIKQIDMKDENGNDLAGFEFELDNVPQGSSIYAAFYDENNRITRVVSMSVPEPEKHIRLEKGFEYQQGYETSAHAMVMTKEFEPLCSSIAAELK